MGEFVGGVFLFFVALVLGVIGALVTGFFVWLFLHFTSIDALHISYWNSFFIACAIGAATTKLSASSD